MGVMSCSRSECDNIMCDTYIDDVGYVCYECKEEFKDYLSKEGISVAFEGEISRELKKFMDTRKNAYNKGSEIEVDDFFRKHTKY